MSLVDLIYPIICVGCKHGGKYICDNCQKKITHVEQICPMCCKPSLDGWTHPRCRSRYGLDRLMVGLSYHGVVQNCLKKIKYRGTWDMIKGLLELCDFGEVGERAVTAVPMWKNKIRERGFNQAEMIGKLIATHYKVPSFVMIERIKNTKPMYGLCKDERYKNIKNAFKYVGKQIPDKIILVDDVWTTGATMRECTLALKQAGVREVWGVALAR